MQAVSFPIFYTWMCVRVCLPYFVLALDVSHVQITRHVNAKSTQKEREKQQKKESFGFW